MFCESGSRDTASPSSRSQLNVLTPRVSSHCRDSASLKRLTAITSSGYLAASAARRARTASVGPIFPPAPRTSRGLATVLMNSTSSTLGRVNTSSNSASFRIISGRAGEHSSPESGSVGCMPSRNTPSRMRVQLFGFSVSVLVARTSRPCKPKHTGETPVALPGSWSASKIPESRGAATNMPSVGAPTPSSARSCPLVRADVGIRAPRAGSWRVRPDRPTVLKHACPRQPPCP